MTDNWILDVLADLKSFAVKNDLPILAAQLDDTTIVAMAELASQQSGDTPVKEWTNGEVAGRVSGNT